MRRILAVVGFSFFAVNFGAAFLPSAAFWLLTVFVCLICIFRWRQNHYKFCKEIILFSVILCAFFFRQLYMVIQVNPLAHWQGQTASIQAVIQQVLSSPQQAFSSAIVRVYQVNEKRVMPFSLRVSGVFQAKEGQIIQTNVLFEPILNQQMFLSAKGVHLAASLTKDAHWNVHETKRPLRELREKMSLPVQQLLPEREASMIQAITLGDKQMLAKEDVERFRDVGIAHILVVSGLHLSMVSGAVYWILRKIFSRTASAAFASIITLFYILMVGYSPSIFRAGVMMLFLYLGQMLRRRADSFTSIGFALLLLCVQNPFSAADLGLLLSFSATVGVLVSSRWLQKKVLLKTWRQRLFAPIQQAVMISFGASLASFPFLILFEQKIPFYSILSNLLIYPVTSLILFAGLLAQCLSLLPFFSLFVPFFVLLSGLGVKWLLFVADGMSKLPFVSIKIAEPFFAWLILCVYFLFWYTKIHHKNRWLFTTIFSVVIISIWAFFQHDLIMIQLLGKTANAPILITQDKHAVLILRSDTALETIPAILKEQGRANIDFVIDARKNPQPLDLAQQGMIDEIFVVQTEMLQHKVLDDIMKNAVFYLMRQQNGVAFIFDFDGVLVGTAQGKIDWRNLPKVDLYISAGTLPDYLAADTVMTTRKLDVSELENKQVSYKLLQENMGDQIEVRAGHAFLVKER